MFIELLIIFSFSRPDLALFPRGLEKMQAGTKVFQASAKLYVHRVKQRFYHYPDKAIWSEEYFSYRKTILKADLNLAISNLLFSLNFLNYHLLLYFRCHEMWINYFLVCDENVEEFVANRQNTIL